MTTPLQPKTVYIPVSVDDLLFMKKQGVATDVVGYEGLYVVDIFGNIYSMPRNTARFRILKQTLTKFGYLTVEPSKNGSTRIWRVHRIVATAFVGNPGNKPHVNHKDGNKANNRKDNLEWCTQSENDIHASRVTKTKYRHKGGKHPMAKVGDADVVKIREMKAGGVSIKTLCKKFNLSVSGLNSITRGVTHKHLL